MESSRLDVGKSAVRGGAAIVVALDHAHSLFIQPYTGTSAISVGLSLAAHYAVMIFFAISGHLIAASIFSNIDRNKVYNIQKIYHLKIGKDLSTSPIFNCIVRNIIPVHSVIFAAGLGRYPLPRRNLSACEGCVRIVS